MYDISELNASHSNNLTLDTRDKHREHMYYNVLYVCESVSLYVFLFA